MEKISIIVPVYNSSKYLEKCLDSIVNQTYQNIEIIVINDGSTDDSPKIIDRYYKKYPEKVIPFSWSNHGIGASRNKGISLASGKYITFIDSDDYLNPDMISVLYQNLTKNKADVAICNYRQFDDFGNSNEIIVTDESLITNLSDKPWLINKYNFAPWNKLYKKSLFKDIKFPTKYKYEDLSTILKVFLKSQKIVNVNSSLYNYYVNQSGETKTINYRNYDMYYILNDIITYCQNNQNYLQLKEDLKEFCVYRIYEIFGNMIDRSDNKLLYDFIKKSIILLNKNFSNWSKYITNNSFKNFILSHKLSIYIYINLRRKHG